MVMTETVLPRQHLWLHEEALRADHPLFAAKGGMTLDQPDKPAGPDHPAGPEMAGFMIWDNAYLDTLGYGLKRRFFIYEAVLQLPVSLYQGAMVETVLALTGAEDHVFVAATANPLLRRHISAVAEQRRLTVIADETFVRLPEEVDLRRFFRFWNKAKKSAMKRWGGEEDLFAALQQHSAR